MAKGTTNSYDDNTVNGKETIKMGKSGAGGNMTITVAAGATSLSFYSAAWKNEGAEVTIEAPTGVTITPASYTVVATDELSGGGKSFTVANEENYKFTFALTGVTEAATFTLTSAKRCFVWGAEDDTEAPSLEGYFLVGTFNDWTPAAKYMLDANEAAEGEYVLAFPFAKGDGLKVAKVQGDTVAAWYPDGMGNEYKVDAAHQGRKAIYFRPEGNDDWKAFHDGGFFFIPANNDPTNCDEAREAALSVLSNNELYNDSAVYTIEGFVTEIAYAYDSTKHNMSFWIADADNGGKVLEAYKCAIENEENIPVVGDHVKVTGCLTRYNETPEFAAGCTVEIVKDEPVLGAWSEIVFTEAVAAADLPEDSVFKSDKEGFEAKIADAGNKMSIDGNVARFGTAEEYEKYSFRLKSNGASGSDKNFITISVPTDGKLGIAPRTGSNSDTTRVLYIIQDNDTLYSEVVRESQAVVVMEDTTKVNVYPFVVVPVKAGSVIVRYSAAMNFYAFGFNNTVAPEPEATWTVAGSSATLFGTTWDPANTANDMIKNDEGYYTWSKSGLELAAGDIAFKVCKDHAWAEAYPAQDYKLAIDSAGIYTINISFDLEKLEVSAVATKTGDAVVLPNVILHGNFTGSWKDTEAFVPAEDKLTAALELELAEGTYEFGFKFDGAWKANGANLTREENTTNLATGDGNMHITADKAGKYVFTYTYATQGLIVAYPSAAEADTIVIDALTYGEVLTEDFETYGAVDVILTNIPIVGNQLLGDGYTFVLDILPKDANDITGRYSVDSLSLDTAYSGIIVYQGTDTTMLSLANAEVIFQIGQVSVESNLAQLAVLAELVTEDGTVFEIAAATVVYYEFVEEQGIEEIMAESENGKAIKLMHEGQIYILKGNKLYNLSGQVVR